VLNGVRRTIETTRRIFRILVLFAVLRLLLGLAIIALFDREAIAWGIEATLIVAATCAMCVGVALRVRRSSAPAHP
jgi:hypothetical protein